MLKHASLFIGLVLVLAGCGDGKPAALTDAQAEKVAREGILQFRKGMCSADEKARLATCDKFMVDKALFERLFGKSKEAADIWTKMDERLKKLRGTTEKAKAEVERHGAIKEVKVTDARKDPDEKGESVYSMLPKDVRVYKARITAEKGTSGSSGYLVVDGKLRWFPGIGGVCARLKPKKK